MERFKTCLLLLLILLRALRRLVVVASAWRSGAPVGTRTPNQLIKSQLLYQLSYRGNILYSNALQKSHFGVVCRLCMLQVRDDETTDSGHKGGRQILKRHSRPNL